MLLILCLAMVSIGRTNAQCPPPLVQLDKDIQGRVEGDLSTLLKLGKIKAVGDITTTTNEFFHLYPNADKIAMQQNVLSIICSQVLPSPNYSNDFKQSVVNQLLSLILNKGPPSGDNQEAGNLKMVLLDKISPLTPDDNWADSAVINFEHTGDDIYNWEGEQCQRMFVDGPTDQKTFWFIGHQDGIGKSLSISSHVPLYFTAGLQSDHLKSIVGTVYGMTHKTIEAESEFYLHIMFDNKYGRQDRYYEIRVSPLALLTEDFITSASKMDYDECIRMANVTNPSNLSPEFAISNKFR
jgi:hypothetical protein